MLTRTLRALQRDGLVTRTVYPTVPAAVEYALTELGHTLLDPLSALTDWAITHRQDIDEARIRHDEAEGALRRGGKGMREVSDAMAAPAG